MEINIRNTKLILDAAVIITLLKNEACFEKLEELMASAAMSTVNYSEVISVLIRNGISENETEEIMLDIVPVIIPLTKEIAILAGRLIATTIKYGLSFGDRACIATGIIHNLPIYTADKAWADLGIAKANIVVIRSGNVERVK